MHNNYETQGLYCEPRGLYYEPQGSHYEPQVLNYELQGVYQDAPCTYYAPPCPGTGRTARRARVPGVPPPSLGPQVPGLRVLGLKILRDILALDRWHILSGTNTLLRSFRQRRRGGRTYVHPRTPLKLSTPGLTWACPGTNLNNK